MYLSFFYSLRRNFKTYLNTGFVDFYLMPKYIIECILVTFFLIFIFKIHWHGFSKGAKRLPSTYNTIQCLFKSLWNIFLSFFLPHLKLISGKNAIWLQNRRWVLFNLKQARNCHISAISRKRGGKYLCSYTLCVPSQHFFLF